MEVRYVHSIDYCMFDVSWFGSLLGLRIVRFGLPIKYLHTYILPFMTTPSTLPLPVMMVLLVL